MVALFVYLLSIACWLGAIVFFSFFTAPAIFQELPVAEAGKVIGAIFPRYYALGYAAGIVAVLLAAYFTAMREARGWWGGCALTLAVALGITLYAGGVLLPRVAQIRSVTEQQNPDAERKAEFDRLHHLSVVLNGMVLMLNLAALAETAGALTHRG
ncbi:MAG TPA: DUF4149 domain-containing protein [Candidatus Binataceae bacterium]|nr:DUF4149 domain-containing protein [Candidatus Binataceae bacterium]